MEEKKSGLSSILLIRRLITEANLLFDFEVARRLVDGDRYFDLPIVTYLPYLIKNLEICNNFIAGKKSSEWGGSKGDTLQSLFTGVERLTIVAQELTRRIGFKSPQEIRNGMSCLCQDDELSDCEYVYQETTQESDVEELGRRIGGLNISEEQDFNEYDDLIETSKSEEVDSQPGIMQLMHEMMAFEEGRNVDPRMTHAQRNFVEEADQLIKGGRAGDINSTYRGLSVFHYAAMCDEGDLIKLFLQNGANPPSIMLSMLVEKAEDLEIDHHYTNVLQLAHEMANPANAKRNFITEFRLLFESDKAGDINSIDNKGLSAIHYAARCDNKGLVGLLLQRGADPRIDVLDMLDSLNEEAESLKFELQENDWAYNLENPDMSGHHDHLSLDVL